MIVPVFTPPPRVDATNLAEFARTVGDHVARHRCMVIDCSEVVWIAASGMHVLEKASSDASIALLNPTPAVHLMAAAFGGNVQCRFDRVRSPKFEVQVPRLGLASVHIDGKVAS